MFLSPFPRRRDQSGAKPRRNRSLADRLSGRGLPGGLERLEARTLPAVSILNGGGLGYAGTGGDGPPDETGAAGPNSYMEVNNNSITLYSPKSGGAVLATHGIGDFFYNPSIGNQTRIENNQAAIAASPTGAAEATVAGVTTVTITTAAAHGFLAGQTASISGVGLAGYNGGFKITAVTPTTFTYTDNSASGLANSGGGTATVASCGTCDSTGVFDNLMGTNGRFIIGEIDVDSVSNVSQYIFAVSTSSNPTALNAANWNFYHVTTTEGSGGSTSWSDYPGNPGFNADAFVETFNMFGGGPTGTQVVSVKAGDLAAGNPLVTSGAGQNVFRNDVPGGARDYRPTTMHDSTAGDPMWLIHNPNTGTTIDVVKMTGVLSNAPAFSTTSPALPAQDDFVASGGIGNPLNPDNSGMFDPGNLILKAGEYNKTIVAAHTVAVASGPNTLASAQANDKNGNSTGGSGYTVGETLTVNGGTFTTAATLTVQTLGSGGGIATVGVSNPGSYSSLSGINGSVTGGTGSGASLSLFFTGELVAQWYAIDVSGGTPAFQIVGGGPNVGRVGFGANTYSYEPAVDINSSGQIGLGFMESDTVGGAADSATKGFTSTFVTARMPTDAAGTMETPVLVSARTGFGNINGRIGDFSGMNVDPVNGTFWHANEFGGGPGQTVIANFTPNAPPTLSPPTAPQTSVEGISQSFSLGSFADPNGGPWTIDVSWGDGAPDTVFTATAPGPITPKSHLYVEEGVYTGTIKVTDAGDGQFDSQLFSVIVADADLTVGPATLLTANTGVALPAATIVGAFIDANTGAPAGDFLATIDWGDGSPTATGVVVATGPGAFSVEGGHTYAKPGAYATKISVLDDGGETTLVTGSATVGDLAVTGATLNFTTIEDQGAGPFVLATFTDPNTLAAVADVNAVLNANGWGDGTPAAAGITLEVQQIGVTPRTSATDPGAPIFEVLGSHNYVKQTPPGAPDSLSVMITTLGGVSTTLTSLPGGGVTVLDANLTSSNGAEIAGVEGVATPAATLLGTFIDANQAATSADFLPLPMPGGNGGSVVVDWGDGSAPQTLTAANLAVSGTPDGVIFSVRAAHTYSEEATYAYSVAVTDEGGATTTFVGSAIIADAALTAPAQTPISTVEASIFPVPVFAPPLFNNGPVASFQDASPNSKIADFKATIDWGDGAPLTAGTILQPGGVGTAYIVRGSHTYAESGDITGTGNTGRYPIQVFVVNDGGSILTVDNTANVADNSIVLTGQLNPQSDSGLSTGAVDTTNVKQPDFFGKSEPLSTVTLSATLLPSGTPFIIGQVEAGGDGSWNINSDAPLVDGRYTITATAIDQFGQTNTTTPPSPVVITSDLLIDTKGPVVDGVFFNRLNGQVDYIIKDPGATPSGAWLPSILDSANYQLTKVHANKAYPGKWIVTNVTAAPDPTIANAFDVAVTFDGGAVLHGGFYLFTIRDSSTGNASVRDLAENHLDGEFYGSFPSGNGVNSGDFVAELQAYHRKIFAPQTIVGTAFAGNGGNGGKPVAPVHSGIWAPVVPRGGSPIFSTSTSPSNGGDPPAAMGRSTHRTKGHGGVRAKHGESPRLTSTSHAKHQALVVGKNHPKGPKHQEPSLNTEAPSSHANFMMTSLVGTTPAGNFFLTNDPRKG